jgi:hypothetical protein
MKRKLYAYRAGKWKRNADLLICLLNEGGPVLNGAHESTAVDIVVLLAIGPLLFEVIDFESAILWNPVGLDR